MIRKIHLDFHTHPTTLNVGEKFDPEVFADTLARANVNCIATPGKCQYGETYFDTALGHPHPHLVRPDLFPATVAACAARGIRVQAYFTLGLDDVAAAAHPEWRQRYKDGSIAAWGAKHICFASPYADKVVIPEALEMIERCPEICGFWFDICLYCNGAFHSDFFNAAARKKLGKDADDENQRWHLARKLIRDCCQRIDNAIRQRLPDAENYFNSLAVPGEEANINLQPIQEVENPVFFGGPEVMTANARWLRWHGRPVIGLVSRFQGPWMDPGTLRTPDQLRFDVVRTLALGCHVSMGDHRHPDGTLDPIVYERIGPIYGEVLECEPWLEDAVPCREAVLISDVDCGSPHLLPGFPNATLHAARILEEIGLQFDIATRGEKIPDARLLITTGRIPKLSKGRKGTAILVIGADPSGDNGKDSTVNPAGHVAQVQQTFMRCCPELGIGSFAHSLTLPFAASKARGEVLAEQFPAASQAPACVGSEPIGPAIVQKGNVVYCAPRLFEEQREAGTAYMRELIAALRDRLLGQRLVCHDAGTSVAANLLSVRQGYALHLVHWAGERWDKKFNPVAVFPRLGPIKVELRIPERVRKITLEPSGKSIAFKQSKGVSRFVIPGLCVSQLIGIATGRKTKV